MHVHVMHLFQEIRESKIGTICNDFGDLKNEDIIGRGAFGVVHLHTTTSGEKLAIKKEIKVHAYVYTVHYIMHICMDSIP